MIQTMFQSVWDTFQAPLQAGTTALTGNLQTWVNSWLGLAVVAYLVVYMLVAAWTAEESHATQFFRHLFLAAVVYSIATTLGAYQQWVTNLLHGFASGMTNAITGNFGVTQTPATAFANLNERAIALGSAVMAQVPSQSSYINEIVLGGVVLGYWIDVMFVTWLTFGVFMISSFLTDFVMAFGPVFVTLYFFPFTRGFFDGWVRVLVAGVLVQVFLIGDLAMVTSALTTIMHSWATILDPKATGAAAGDIGHAVIMLFGAGGVLTIFLLLSGAGVMVANAISGGVHALALRLPLPSGSGGTRLPAAPRSGGAPASGGNPGGGSVAPAGAAPRAHAFQRSVGAAP